MMMIWFLIGLRVMVGIAFLVFGLNFFVPFLPMPKPELPEDAAAFGAVLFRTHYMDVVKALEILGGVLLVSGRMAPLGLTILVPVTVNIALWDLLLMKLSGPPLGIIFLICEIILMVGYRGYFVSVLTMRARFTGSR
jgi:hypothetical protein